MHQRSNTRSRMITVHTREELPALDTWRLQSYVYARGCTQAYESLARRRIECRAEGAEGPRRHPRGGGRSPRGSRVLARARHRQDTRSEGGLPPYANTSKRLTPQPKYRSDNRPSLPDRRLDWTFIQPRNCPRRRKSISGGTRCAATGRPGNGVARRDVRRRREYGDDCGQRRPGTRDDVQAVADR